MDFFVSKMQTFWAVAPGSSDYLEFQLRKSGIHYMG